MPGRLQAMPARVTALPKQVDPFYRSADWQALRKAKLAQGRARCCVCGIGMARGVRMILDHRVERKDGGADNPGLDGLDWFCIAHHNAKTAAAKASRGRGVGGG